MPLRIKAPSRPNCLGVDTGTWIELGGDTACKLQPHRLFDQRHLIDPKRRRRASVPIAPKIGARVRLPHLTVVADDGPNPAHAQPSGRTRGRTEPNWAQAVIAFLERNLLPDDLRLRLQHKARPERQRDRVATSSEEAKPAPLIGSEANCVIALPL
jgi:hypothetical protein